MSAPAARTETLVGLFLLIGLGLLAALVIVFGRFDDRLADHYGLTVIFDDAAGLIRGSEVRMGGARIGKVSAEPQLTDEVKVRVPIQVLESIRIPVGSDFQISSASILGDKLIVITPPSEAVAARIAPDSVVEGAGASGLDAIQNHAVEVSRDVRRLLGEAETTLGSIDAAVSDIRDLALGLRQTVEKVNVGLLSDENVGHVAAVLAQLDEASGQFSPVLADTRKALLAVDEAAAAARLTFDRATRRIDELEPALREVPGAVASLSQFADRAAETLERVDEGEGLLGTLTQDEQVSDDARQFIRNLRRDGILRYRDEASEGPEDDPRQRFESRRR